MEVWSVSGGTLITRRHISNNMLQADIRTHIGIDLRSLEVESKWGEPRDRSLPLAGGKKTCQQTSFVPGQWLTGYWGPRLCHCSLVVPPGQVASGDTRYPHLDEDVHFWKNVLHSLETLHPGASRVSCATRLTVGDGAVERGIGAVDITNLLCCFRCRLVGGMAMI